MRNLVKPCLSFACAILANAAIAQDTLDIADYVVELDERVEEKTLASYANEWWQWAFSMHQSRSPIRDQEGTFCNVNQSGSVWYLAGGFGTSKISRTCTVPPQKHLFFPVINMVTYSPDSSMTCDQAKEQVAQNNNNFTYVRVSLNGSQLEDAERFRIAPEECFDIFERVPEEYNAPSADPSATDGFWIMLEPLPAGQHTLEFRAFYTKQGSAFGDMVQNISYDLTVLAD